MLSSFMTDYAAPLVVAATVGAAGIRVPSVQTSVGAQVVLDSENMPFFSITNTHTAAADVVLALVWQELKGKLFR